MKLERHPTADEVASRAADLVAETLVRKPYAVLVLPAGDTPVPLCAELVRRQAQGAIDLGRAHLFQLDELLGVEPRDARSFHGFLRRHLLDRVDRAPGRDHLLNGGTDDPAAEIERHRRALEQLGSADLVLLGIGRNSHVAFNEPGSERDAGARVVELSESTVAGLKPDFGDGDSPASGMTLGMREILAARSIVLLVTGASKAESLAALVRDAPSLERPASLLVGHGEFCVLTDEAASRLLDEGEA